jgi:hypothetical protein
VIAIDFKAYSDREAACVDISGKSLKRPGSGFHHGVVACLGIGESMHDHDRLRLLMFEVVNRGAAL